jgi:hypothetical protein
MPVDSSALPPERNLTEDRLVARRDHLIREIETSRARRTRLHTPAALNSRRTRVGLGGVLAAALIAFVTPAFGGKLLRALDPPNDPIHVAAKSAQAHEVLSVPLQSLPGKQFVLWTAPSPTGGLCEFVQIVDASVATPAAQPNAGGTCTTGPPTPLPASVPLAPTMNWLATPGGKVAILLRGRISPASGVTQVNLDSASGATPLVTRDGYFLGEFPQLSDGMGQLPSSGGPWSIVGLDATGAVLGSVDLQKFVQGAHPH